MRRALLWFAVAVAGLAILPHTAAAQNSRTNVLNQLNVANRSAAARGFRPDPTVFDRSAVVGMLASRSTSFLELNLVGGANYFIVAACDEDCSDLDLRLFPTTSRTAFVEDTGEDDNPVISFTAPRTGRYMLAVDMARCQERLCYYAYRVLRR